ncbi:MAG: ferritin-like domain-containing protein [Janthinobacterium lividum]
MKTMNDLFLHFLQDIYYAEKAFAKTSSKIMKSVQNEDVREILKKAKDNAHEPIEAMDRVFEAVGKRPRGKTCEAMNGLLAECQEAIEEGEPGPVLDAALIASLQGIKTYEVTRYGSLLAFARQMGLDDAIKDLETLRDAARNDDQALSKIAESSSNVEASKEEGEDDEKVEPEENEEPGEPDDEGKPETVKKPAAKRSKR